MEKNINSLEIDVFLDLNEELKTHNRRVKTEISEVNEAIRELPFPIEWVFWYTEFAHEYIEKAFQKDVKKTKNKEDFQNLPQKIQEFIKWHITHIDEVVQRFQENGVAVQRPRTKEEFISWYETSIYKFQISPDWNSTPYEGLVFLQKEAAFSPVTPNDITQLNNSNILLKVGLYDERQKEILKQIIKYQEITTYQELITLYNQPIYKYIMDEIELSGNNIDILVHDLVQENFLSSESEISTDIIRTVLPYFKERSINQKLLIKLYSTYYNPRMKDDEWQFVKKIIVENKDNVQLHDINFLLWSAQDNRLLDLYYNTEQLDEELQVFNDIKPAQKSQELHIKKCEEEMQYIECISSLNDVNPDFFSKIRLLYEEYAKSGYTDVKKQREIQKNKKVFLKNNDINTESQQDVFTRITSMVPSEWQRLSQKYIEDKKAIDYFYEYCERPDLHEINTIKKIEINVLKNALQDKKTKQQIGIIVWNDINKFKNTELGGHIEVKTDIETGNYFLKLRTSPIPESHQNNGAHVVNKMNSVYTPKAHFSFHLHATDIDDSLYSGPSGISIPHELLYGGDMKNVVENGANDIVITTMGHPLDSEGEEIKDRINVNLDLYYKKQNNKRVQVFDLGIYQVPYKE